MADLQSAALATWPRRHILFVDSDSLVSDSLKTNQIENQQAQIPLDQCSDDKGTEFNGQVAMVNCGIHAIFSTIKTPLITGTT